MKSCALLCPSRACAMLQPLGSRALTRLHSASPVRKGSGCRHLQLSEQLSNNNTILCMSCAKIRTVFSSELFPLNVFLRTFSSEQLPPNFSSELFSPEMLTAGVHTLSDHFGGVPVRRHRHTGGVPVRRHSHNGGIRGCLSAGMVNPSG